MTTFTARKTSKKTKKKIVYERKKSFAISENEHITHNQHYLICVIKSNNFVNAFDNVDIKCNISDIITNDVTSATDFRFFNFIANDVAFRLQRIFVNRQSLNFNISKKQTKSLMHLIVRNRVQSF